LLLARRDGLSEGKMTKEELREDPVLEGLGKMKKFIDEKGFYLLIVVLVGIAAVVGSQVFRRMGARAEQRAAVLVLDGESQYQQGNLPDALTKFKQAYENQKGAMSGKLGLLRAADCQAELGNTTEAKGLYEKFLSSPPKDGLLKASGLRGLAAVLDGTGQHEQAAKTYLDASGIAESPLRADDLVSAGFAFGDAGKWAEAKDAFQKVIEGFPDSPRARDAREGLETARAHVGS
jgi:predicted negative regulator of RcsB-dependent stress response